MLLKKIATLDFTTNKTDITPTVIYGVNEIILANWPNNKHIICNALTMIFLLEFPVIHISW